MPLVELRVEGMTCGHCTDRVEKALTGVAGVDAVRVDLDGGTASVEADSTVEVAKLVATVERSGYDASVV